MHGEDDQIVPFADAGPLIGQAAQVRHDEGLPGIAAWDADDECRADQYRPARIPENLRSQAERSFDGSRWTSLTETMMSENVATQLVHTLARAGVRRIFGLAGDSLNGITEALRQQSDIAWIHVRHEEVAAFAASGEAQLTGNLAVCAGSCGPGQSAPDQRPVRRPSQPDAGAGDRRPHPLGGGRRRVFPGDPSADPVSANAAIIASSSPIPAQLPFVIENAIRAAVGRRGVAVIVLPGDVALRAASPRGTSTARALLPPAPVVQPAESDVDALAALLNGRGARDAILRPGLRRRPCTVAAACRGVEEPDRARVWRQGIR